MVRIELDITKSLEENASAYFEQAKKLRKKAEGARKAVSLYRMKLEEARQAHAAGIQKQAAAAAGRQQHAHRKKEWYEKFRWFISSEGVLVVGGRDATTNELIVKKHTEKHDVVFHTDMSGSPFFVVKTGGKAPGQATLQETANATFVFSRAFKLGMGTTDVFYVAPEQVSKEPNPGEYLPKGAFVIRGKTTYLEPRFDLAVGLTKGNAVMAGPAAAVKRHCLAYVILAPGKANPSDIAKKIRAKLQAPDLDEVLRSLPPGEVVVQA